MANHPTMLLSKLIARLRPQYATVAENCTRDFLFQIVSGLGFAVLTAGFGMGRLGFLVGLLVVIYEFSLLRVFSDRVEPHSRAEYQNLALAMLLTALAPFAYMIGAVGLALHTSLAVKILSALLLVSAPFYMFNKWSRIPVLLGIVAVPCFVLMVIGFYNLSQTMPVLAPESHWAVVLAYVVVMFMVARGILIQHLDTEADLIKTRDMASIRLGQLEESHRLDPLTGVLNRNAFDRAVQEVLIQNTARRGCVGVFLLDLDNFKPINDTYSHDAGDAILIEIGQRLKKVMGNRGVVARMGGDEFIAARCSLTGVGEARSLAKRISLAMSDEIEWNQRKLRTGASVGFAVTCDTVLDAHQTVHDLCAAADQAMFACKSSASREPVLYQDSLFPPRMGAADRQLLAEGIRAGTVKPYYQPKLNLRTGEFVGFEALARWETPDGVKRPADFLDQIHELGLQADLMSRLAITVVEDTMRMKSLGLDPGDVSLNLSEVALATHTGQQELRTIIAANPEAASHLTFEITEDVFIGRSADMIQASIAEFRGLGVRISLDDFGTGFASFHHLRQLDFDELKIDASFIHSLGEDPASEVLINGFLSIASGLGVKVIAEGIETEGQRMDLLRMGCEVGQGYLFSSAMPIDTMITMMQNLPQTRPAAT